MLIVDKNCVGSKGGHKVNFSRFNCRFTVQKGGIIDLEKSVPIIKSKKMGDLNRVAAELLSRSQYEQVPIKELSSEPKKADEKKKETKKADEDPKGEAEKKDNKKK